MSNNVNKKDEESVEFLNNSEREDEAVDFDDVETDEIFQWDTFNYSIRGSVTNTDIESMINALGDGTCTVPGFQRRFVWTKDQVSRLAFSIIKGIPVPPIYVYFDEDEGNEVILDGQQRMTALFLYFYGIYFQRENKRKKINFKDICSKMAEKRKLDEEISNESARDKKKELIERKKSILDYLKTSYEIVETEYYVKDNSGNKHDITFEHFKEKEKRYLKRKSLQYAVVECAEGDSPQTFYTMVFKMLNSAGKNLGRQEVRNGLYWKTKLYRGLFEINEDESLSWRQIYGRLSLYSKDVELLLKMLALNYYTRLNVVNQLERIDIIYSGTFNWGNIMNEYSQKASCWSDEEVAEELQKLRSFFERIDIDSDPSLCRKATLEAVFVCMNKLRLIGDGTNVSEQISLSWLNELSQDKNIFGDGKVLSNKDSVQTRITETLPKVKLKYEKH